MKLIFPQGSLALEGFLSVVIKWIVWYILHSIRTSLFHLSTKDQICTGALTLGNNRSTKHCRAEGGVIAWRVPPSGPNGQPRSFKLHCSRDANLNLTGGETFLHVLLLVQLSLGLLTSNAQLQGI
jgi:hypothetical protein